MTKIRVYELADKWKVEKSRLLVELNKRGHNVKSVLSSVEESDLGFTLEKISLKDSEPEPKKGKLPSNEPKFGGKEEKQSHIDTVKKGLFRRVIIVYTSLIFGAIVSLMLISVFSQLSEIKKEQGKIFSVNKVSAARINEISKATLRQSQVNDKTAEQLDEHGKLINGIMKEISFNPKKPESLSHLRLQADILRDLASPPSEGASSESFSSWRKRERINGLGKAINELLLDVEGTSSQ